MNEQQVTSFVKQALASGMSQQDVATLLKKAEEISSRGTTKVATDKLDQIVSGLLKEAGLEKTASSIAYTNGILKEALDQGAAPDQAVSFAKEGLAKTSADLQAMYKLASIFNHAELGPYAEGFIKGATDNGMSQADAANLLIDVISKQADDGMFKQPASAHPAPGAGDGDADDMGGPGDGDADDMPAGPGGAPSPAGQLPPEVIQQILALLAQQQQGGQGGPQGMPPQGMPPQQMPPGMPGQGGPAQA